MRPIPHPSPNHGERRGGALPELIVVHYTAMQSAGAALERLCDPDFEVSAHYLVGRDGQLWQLVDEARRAWHAGTGSWQGRTDVNSRSIGIELDNTGRHPFPEPQMRVLEALVSEIRARWGIPAEGVIGHSDMAPGRKVDPGPRFDWTRLERQGLARPPRAVLPGGAAEPGAFRALAAGAGYPATAGDEALLEAVRLRLRPWATGPLEAADVAALCGDLGGDRGGVA
ncbi:N-acetylmuramoyl-L-alanine amidase [Marinibacterium profundimaris]|uniref:N-acetylmuramoyl-L-alanine amidase n=1 Tax=Marinibacterium profundimaris TaxID=1679460 RepID=A0A225NGC8_9RHOB|nr:N-acetylmuramoyl-L-alanine amidase [Marinibacterium profundimaris]OWU72526.1 N-acetylmuramoyl-L-alanine amidase [Marinibacterium profundimaris]